MTAPEQPAPRSTPWSSLDAPTSLWTAAFGALLVCWSWWEASGSASQDDQTGWAVVAILGVGAAAMGLVAWLRAGRRALVRRRDELVAAITEAVQGRVAPVLDLGEEEQVTDALVGYPQSGRRHRPDCLLVRGKAVSTLTADAVRTSDSCGMCGS